MGSRTVQIANDSGRFKVQFSEGSTPLETLWYDDQYYQIVKMGQDVANFLRGGNLP